MSYPANAPPSYDWFISAPSLPRIQAVYDPGSGVNYSETFTNANLTVSEGSFLLLICAAFYNVSWSIKTGGVSDIGSKDCGHGLEDDWPSRKCLLFHSVKREDSGVYSCSQSVQSDPNLITNVQLNVASTQTTSSELRITRRSFDTVLTWTRRSVELTVEYDFGSPCSSKCQGTWILLPRTILDGHYDAQSAGIVSSSNSTSYAYVDTKQVSPKTYQSRLVIPRTCYQYSGLYRFQLGDKNLTMVDFNVTIQLSPWRLVDPSEGRDGLSFTARLLQGRVYEISCLRRTLGTLGNVTVDTEFLYSPDPQICGNGPRYKNTDNNLPDEGFFKELAAVQPMCQPSGPPTNATPVQLSGSTFTLTAKRPGMVRCSFNWTTTDSNGHIYTNGTVTEFRYKVVDRADLVPFDRDFVIERSPDGGRPLMGDRMVIKCVAPTCQYDKIVLEKESNKLEYDEEHGIVRNDFNGNVSFENTSLHVIVSLTFEKANRFCAGQYFCRGFDQNVPTGSSAALDVSMEQPRPPIFDVTESYTDRVLLQDGKQVQLSCYVDGLPKPTLMWTFNKRPLTSDDGELRYENATLTVRKKGHYQCQAYNKHGSIERDFDVVDENDDKKSLVTEILVGTICAIALLAAICFTVWFIRRWRLASLKKLHSLMLKPAQETLPLESFMPINDQIESLPYDERYEMGRSSFSVSSLLGSGEYGKVYRGLIKSQTGGGGKDVAIKMPRDNLNADHHKALISELKIMIFVRQHINVLSVLGACTKDIQGSGFYIITEYCDRGSLRDHLVSNRDKACSTCGEMPAAAGRNRGSQYGKNIRLYKENNEVKNGIPKHLYVNVEEGHTCSYFTTEKLLSYAYQSASGMEYLAAKNVVHRDLALRNLLLHGEVVKIADFGLSRHHGDAYKSRKFDSPLPIFWMALESILSYKYSEKSDVWSFGVVMWEMFSLGDLPYAGKKPDHQFVQWLREENRMGAPKLAAGKTYDLMLSCWKKDPDTRPTFSECKRNLGQHLDSYSPAAYRALLLTLASAKAATDELPLAPAGAESKDSSGFVTYVVVEGSNKGNAASPTTSDLGSSGTPSSHCSCTMEGDLSDSTVNTSAPNGRTPYLAPCID